MRYACQVMSYLFVNIVNCWEESFIKLALLGSRNGRICGHTIALTRFTPKQLFAKAFMMMWTCLRHLRDISCVTYSPQRPIPPTFMWCLSFSCHYVFGEGNVNTKSLVKFEPSFICLVHSITCYVFAVTFPAKFKIFGVTTDGSELHS
jgi:hypothetical protein